MNKKEREEKEKIEDIKKIIGRNTDFSEKQKELIEHFIFNIITSNTVMKKYECSMYGNIIENNIVYLNDCIEYLGKKILKENKE